MNDGVLSELQEKADGFKTGIDYLRIILKDEHEEEENFKKLADTIKRLDSDNSNFQTLYFADKKLSLFKIPSRMGEALIGSVVYNDIPVPIIFFEKYGDNSRKLTNSWGKIDYYGMFYRLVEIGYINKNDKKNTLYNFFNELNYNKKISRLDWKIDFFYKGKKKIFSPSKITKLRSNSKVEYKVMGPKIQSWRLGDRKSKRYLIRGYDKLADTAVKGKFAFYKDYFKFENVYRLEFEFLNHFCRNYIYNELDQFVEYIEKFLKHDKSIGAIFESKNNTDMEEVKDRFKYADITKGYVKGCILNGINIFGLLEEVFESMGKNEEEIIKIFSDYLYRKKYLLNMIDKKEDLDLYDLIIENKYGK